MNGSARRASAAMCLVGLGVTAMMTGCSKHNAIANNPTPELYTLSLRDVDSKNQQAIWWHENWRMVPTDLGRALYLDRPSRLTREPVPPATKKDRVPGTRSEKEWDARTLTKSGSISGSVGKYRSVRWLSARAAAPLPSATLSGISFGPEAQPAV